MRADQTAPLLLTASIGDSGTPLPISIRQDDGAAEETVIEQTTWEGGWMRQPLKGVPTIFGEPITNGIVLAGITMGLFDKKYCDICGEKIGLLGNRKLENGNLCKNCAKKLSPWFEERRHSTVEEIRNQLQYREENRGRAAQFCVTRSMGEFTKVLLDEQHRWLTVTSAHDLEEENPDILDFDAITGCRMDIKEDRDEIKREGPDGKEVSYNPPRYSYSYVFRMIISVRSPYFDEMRFRLNSSDVEMSPMPTSGMGGFGRTRTGFGQMGFDPMDYPEYRKYYNMGDEICQAVREMREQPAASAAPAAASAPAAAAPASGPWSCPGCGAQNSGKFCEFCGTPRP